MFKPEQIKSHRFISNTKGAYEADDVDNFFAEVSECYEQMFSENVDLVKKISVLAEKIKQYKEDEDNIRRALIVAERTSNQIRSEAEKDASEKLEKAEKTYNDMVSAAQNRASVLETKARVEADKVTEESQQAAQERLTNAEKTAATMIANAEKKAHDIVEDSKKFAQQELDRINHEIKVNTAALSALEEELTSFKTALVDSFKKHIEFVEALPREEDFKADVTIIADSNEANELKTEEDVVKAADQFVPDDEAEETEASPVEEAEYNTLIDTLAADGENDEAQEEKAEEAPAADSENEVSVDLSEIQDDIEEEEEKGSIFKNLFNKK